MWESADLDLEKCPRASGGQVLYVRSGEFMVEPGGGGRWLEAATD